MGKRYVLNFAIAFMSTLLCQTQVFSKPMSNSDTNQNNWVLENISKADVRERNTNIDQPTPGHAFIKLETLNSETSIPAGSSIVVQGDSSLRLFKQTDINHPSFDPSKFLKLATNDSVQAVEVYPVSDQPYFMFVPPALLKNQTLTTALFGSLKRRRIKRHHPGVLQNVLGELQNYALVPIKSANGQIRYILLKNPKFVIGNPATSGTNGQSAPAIIQLSSNILPAGLSGGKVTYSPQIPVKPATAPTFRNKIVSRISAPVPLATPKESISNTRNSVSRQSKQKSSKTKETKTSVTSSEIIGLKTKKVPSSETKKTKASLKPVKGKGLKAKTVPNSGIKITKSPQTSPKGGLKTRPVPVAKAKGQPKRPKARIVPNIPRTWKELKLNTIDKKTVTGPLAEKTKTISLRKESKSVSADKVESSASSVNQTSDGLKASEANVTMAKTEANITNVNQTNSKNITVTKVGDQHKIEQTEIIETVVDVKKNETATKTDTAASKVVSTDTVPGHEITNAVNANSGASEKAVAEKQAQVVKKTKKTTTILLKSGSETKSGKAEISEIQHTVEELVHHNTSETNAAESAAAANVDVASTDVHTPSHGHVKGHSHEHSPGHPPEPHTHVDTEKSLSTEAKKETNSTSTSVKTKSVKQTVIKKKIPELSINNSTAVSEASSGTANKATEGGFDVQHIEHVVQETEHKTVDTSQTSNQKASSSANDLHHHHH